MRYKRTTQRFREELAKQARQQPIAQVAQAAEVGPRFVQECFESLIQDTWAKEGRAVEESATLPTPRFLGIDEFARRKGHRYDTILCDLDARTVLEVSAGRKKEEVAGLLERLSNCDGVEAVSMDMATTFLEPGEQCLPV